MSYIFLLNREITIWQYDENPTNNKWKKFNADNIIQLQLRTAEPNQTQAESLWLLEKSKENISQSQIKQSTANWRTTKIKKEWATSKILQQ